MSSTGNAEKTYAQQVRIMLPNSHTLLHMSPTSGAFSAWRMMLCHRMPN